MKLLASGDHHFDEHSRFAECLRVHSWMVDTARERGVDLFLSGGDIFERASTPREREAVAEWLTAMADVCPVVISKGNHDRPLDVALMRRLQTRHPVIVEERAAVHYVGGAAIAAVAWPERTRLLSVSGTSEEAELRIREAFQAVLRGLGDDLIQHNGPRILLGHFMVDGAVTSTGQPLLGLPLNVGLSDLSLARAHLGVMGHIHRAACFDVGGAPHYYTGSPFRTDFGQLEPKSVLFAEFDGPFLVCVEEIETPATPMIHLDIEFRDGFLDPSEAEKELVDETPGAEIRVRYRVNPDEREAARAKAHQLAAWLREKRDAVHVKTEEVVRTETRARAADVARATTVSEKLTCFWDAQKRDPGDRRAALLDKLNILEEESRAA